MRSYLLPLLAGTLALASPAFADEPLDQLYEFSQEQKDMAAEMEKLSDARGIAKAVRNYSGSEMNQGDSWISYKFAELENFAVTRVPEQGMIGASAVEVTYVDRGNVGVSDGDLLIYRLTGTDRASGDFFSIVLREFIGGDGEIVIREGDDFVPFEDRGLIDQLRYELAVSLASVL